MFRVCSYRISHQPSSPSRLRHVPLHALFFTSCQLLQLALLYCCLLFRLCANADRWVIAFWYSGKGTPRRKVKKVHKSSGTDDKKLQGVLKKLNVQPIQAIEEVNMFKEDGNVIHFAAPKGNSDPVSLWSIIYEDEWMVGWCGSTPCSPRRRAS